MTVLDETHYARTLADIANELGMNIWTVRDIERRALKKIRLHLRRHPEDAAAVRALMSPQDEPEMPRRGRGRVWRAAP